MGYPLASAKPTLEGVGFSPTSTSPLASAAAADIPPSIAFLGDGAAFGDVAGDVAPGGFFLDLRLALVLRARFLAAFSSSSAFFAAAASSASHCSLMSLSFRDKSWRWSKAGGNHIVFSLSSSAESGTMASFSSSAAASRRAGLPR